MSPAQYAKAIVGALIAAVGALSAGLIDGSLSLPEIITAVIAFVVTFGGVYRPGNVYVKATVATLVTGLAALASSLTDGGLTDQEIVTVLAAAVVALGHVLGVPNAVPAATARVTRDARGRFVKRPDPFTGSH